MPLVFAGISPHPPILIPNIGKDALKKIEKTKRALEKMEEELYITKPDVIIIISPHGELLADNFTVNGLPEFISDFEQFGDFETKKKWFGTPELASILKSKTDKNNLPVEIIDQQKLDHGTTVPLYYLTNHLKNTRILPMGYSDLGRKEHFEFGQIIKEITNHSLKRIAIIASGDLSHGLTSDAPAGFSSVGEEFDNKIIELLENKNTVGYLNLENDFVEKAAECGYRSILILLGALKNTNCKFRNLSYEGPFGVGYLTGYFEF